TRCKQNENAVCLLKYIRLITIWLIIKYKCEKLKNMGRKFKRLIIKKEVIEDEQGSYCYRWKY
uniref:hypothetical protein n=1 Tax=[Lactobacillus] rogosae TaxID=706562 RepID=UPI003FEDB643